MPISKDLLLAILSMDSYNRGYGAGVSDSGQNDLDGLGESGNIGSARVLARPNGVDYQAWQDADFYAISYTLNADVGEGTDRLKADDTIISFRGTDDYGFFDIGSDIYGGWVTGGGIWQTDQVRLASEFFQSVTGTQTTDPRDGSAVLTGHSLGGGLAGLCAGISPHIKRHNLARFHRHHPVHAFGQLVVVSSD